MSTLHCVRQFLHQDRLAKRIVCLVKQASKRQQPSGKCIRAAVACITEYREAASHTSRILTSNPGEWGCKQQQLPSHITGKRQFGNPEAVTVTAVAAVTAHIFVFCWKNTNTSTQQGSCRIHAATNVSPPVGCIPTQARAQPSHSTSPGSPLQKRQRSTICT